MIRSALLASSPGLAHAHSTRRDGSISPPEASGALEARAALVRAACGVPRDVVTCVQVHGARVAMADRGGQSFPATDGLVTAVRGVPLLVKGADCPLVVLHDPDARVLGVVHSGWRGTLARIVALAVASMRDLGAAPDDVRAAVFPGIGPCCFEVGEDVVSAFAAGFGKRSAVWFAPGDGASKRLFDLRAVLVETLVEAGVRRVRLDVVPGCTACGCEFFSHRATRGAPERHGVCAMLV